MKKAKIVATLGPASAKPDIVKAMINAGVNVIRMNMSHNSQDVHRQNIAMVRSIANELGLPVGILGDLQGPKIRTSRLKNNLPYEIEQDSKIKLTSEVELSAPGVIATSAHELMESLSVGSIVLINDGKLRLEVIDKPTPRTAQCVVVIGGLIEERKGINVPNTHLKVPCMTEKDYADAEFCVREGVDFLALSFVQRAADIDHLRDFIKGLNPASLPAIVAKIERPGALQDIDAILDTTDALMVARGDLGVELSPEMVPVAQKELVQKANAAGRPVIIATQMLESMMKMLIPSRAEVSDVANAVFDGTDALMLSGETAMGDYPVKTVAMMTQIIQQAEIHHELDMYKQVRAPQNSKLPLAQVVAFSACYASNLADVKAIVVLSASGRMARRISKLKPSKRIIALTPSQAVYQKMSLLWGVTPIMVPFGATSEETLALGEALMIENGLLEKDDPVIFCAGTTPLHGITNTMKLVRIGSPTGLQTPEAQTRLEPQAVSAS